VIRATSRCRVDFGGGTLDIWPIGILHPGSLTVNVAVDLPVAVELSPRASGYRVRQGDGERRAASVDELVADPETALFGQVAAAMELPPVDAAIASASPRGAGLGASSALTVALLAAAERLVRGRLELDAEGRAALARDLEARLMGLPTGQQDHLPAQLGGALAIEHRAGGALVRRLAVDLAALGRQLLVAYTGQSHFSAGNNWRVIRARLDGEPETVRRFDAIRDAAAELPAALEAGEWARAGALVSREWEARRGLAPEIDTPAIAGLLDAARELGAWGGKACGAGGGGSVAILAPAAARDAIAARWTELGAAVLAAPPTAKGLELEP
jgi:D-glycero-alpha-D-manno-heptose-7-phosphate kinase